jgi:bacillithiol system protein YtxJ
MNWIPLQNAEQLQEIKEKSNTRPQLIYKHSIRCGISGIVKNRLEKGKLPDDVDYYFIDIIHYRALSNKIAEEFKVYHESPQILLIKNGEAVYDESHTGINPQEIVVQAM